MEEIELIFETTEEGMNDAIERLKRELAKITTGKASPAMFNGLKVEYYGMPTPINQVANITTADARTVVIQPFEKSALASIERSIFEANMGVTPQNDGQIIRINIPPLTEERRRQFVKQAKDYGEQSKIGVRAARRDAMDEIKKTVKDGLSEDVGKKKEQEIQDMTNNYISQIDKLVGAKEKDIMTV